MHNDKQALLEKWMVPAEQRGRGDGVARNVVLQQSGSQQLFLAKLTSLTPGRFSHLSAK